MTVWKDHPDYDGAYQVSDDGRVRSVTRLVNCPVGQRSSPGKELSQVVTEDGRCFANLWRYNEQRSARVHRLVLETFIGPCPEGMECRHLDGDASNNHVPNLVWGTHQENEADRVVHNRVPRGERQGSSKLTTWDVRWIKRFTKHGFSTQQYLAGVFGVCQAQISRIHTGEEWAWLEEKA